MNQPPEKARLLRRLKEGRFNVPRFIYVPAEDFQAGGFTALQAFLDECGEGFKVIARSAHPKEEFFKGGTFDSLETYADVRGIVYARKRIIAYAEQNKRLSILRQQRFNRAPEVDLAQMGVVVMPFIEGMSVMAKMLGDQWEFGYCRVRSHQFASEPSLTRVPHDLRLLTISRQIQEFLGFKCEIEYIVGTDGEIYVVQARDISKVETFERKESQFIRLDGLHRTRKRRNYRERPVFVMNNRLLYIEIISACEVLVHDRPGPVTAIAEVLALLRDFERQMEAFALTHARFGVLGLSIRVPAQLYQIANHYLDETPELQKELSRALYGSQYKVDQFLAEADTLIAREGVGRNLCSHDAYGIDTVRFPHWTVFWRTERHEEVVGRFRRLGYQTGDVVGIDVGEDELPVLYRL